jgi:phosphohistidine phosphatase SixA
MIAILGFLSLPATAADRSETEAVEAVLDSLHLAASQADGEVYFSLFAEEAFFMDTATTERWSVDEFKAYAEPHFAMDRGWTYVVKERHVYVATGAATAWFDEILWNDSYGTCRGTGVLVNNDHGWRIAQYNLTIPIPNDLAADVVRRIKSSAAAAEATVAEEPLVVFLVRHAEKVDTGHDPELSAAGRKRAQELAEVLRDAGIEHVHSSDYIRTRDTAAPIADHLGLKVELYYPSQLPALTTRLLESRGRHLIVGHSNTTLDAVKLLAGDPGPEIDVPGEFDRLYIVTSNVDGTVSTTMIRYGTPFADSSTGF